MGKLNISIDDIDGIYDVTYQAKAPEIPNMIWYDHTKAKVEIKNGVLSGFDEGGCKWDAELKLMPSSKGIEFRAFVNPENTDPDTFIMDMQGNITRTPQTYTGVLDLVCLKENVRLYGNVTHGKVSIEINMDRISRVI